MDSGLDFLVIGHVTLDLTPEGAVPGGAALYASLTAARLGRRVSLLTCGAPIQARESLAALERVVNLPSSATTTFENRYDGGERTQFVHAVAPSIGVDDLPRGWEGFPTVLLAPVFKDVDESLASRFPGALLGVAAQGWLRRAGPGNRALPREWNDAAVLGRAQVVLLSEADMPGGPAHSNWHKDDAILILTRGHRGALMRNNGRWFRIPPYPVQELDPTGAGDVFAAAYLVRYDETGDACAAGLFASCAAALKVEEPGLAGIAGRERITRRMERSQGLAVTPCHGPAGWRREGFHGYTA